MHYLINHRSADMLKYRSEYPKKNFNKSFQFNIYIKRQHVNKKFKIDVYFCEYQKINLIF